MEKELEFVTQTEAARRLGLLRTAHLEKPRAFSRQYVHRVLKNDSNIRVNDKKEVCWQDILNIKPKKLGRKKKDASGII